jgi:UDP-N-acetylmuramoyl-tripeptide--D-alanyl-D-alanine ligase
MHKKYIIWRLQRLVKKYFKRHSPRLVVVTGSVGKTTTKLAIKSVLSERFKVRAQDGNHNTQFSVPLALLGVEYPSNPHSILGWLKVFGQMKRVIKHDDVEVIIQELGTDTKGDVPHFGTYLQPDIAVVTAVSLEHMDKLESIEEVAKEELSVASYSGLTIVNRDDVDATYSQFAKSTNISTYGTSDASEYRVDIGEYTPLVTRESTIHSPDWGQTHVQVQLLGSHTIVAVGAAAAVAAKLGMTAEQFAKAAATIKPVEGRMNVLRGFNNSIIIDDSYNSSPKAALAAIKTLQSIDAPQRIAILGSMNELGTYSEKAHAEVGQACDSGLIDWVVTIGDDAARYLAPAAYDRGCRVKSFRTPYEAGGFVRQGLEAGAVVLVKGSQNGVFSEEAIKVILHDETDETKLVRQSEHWMTIKRSFFDKTTQDNESCGISMSDAPEPSQPTPDNNSPQDCTK